MYKWFQKSSLHLDLIKRSHRARENMQPCNLFFTEGCLIIWVKGSHFFHGGVNAAGYGVGFAEGENTGAGEGGGNALQPVNKTRLL